MEAGTIRSSRRSIRMRQTRRRRARNERDDGCDPDEQWRCCDRQPRNRRAAAARGGQRRREARRAARKLSENVRATCRERVCQYGYITVLAGSLKQKLDNNITLITEYKTHKLKT